MPTSVAPGIRFVEAVYVTDVRTYRPDEEEDVHLTVWMNPETRNLVAIDNMQISVARNCIPDPYTPGVYLVFDATFTGLPK